MVKIVDVAREAGVSTATVSRALNNQEKVDPVLADRVRAAALKLGYRPNHIARSLRRQTSSVIALIISDVENPFFTAVTRGVEDEAQKRGYSVVLCNADEDSDKEDTYLRVAEQTQVAGIILSPHVGSTDISRLGRAGIPIVVIDRPLDVECDSVMVPSFEGAREATKHLLDEGWSTPACITGPEAAATAEERLRGFQQGMADRGRTRARFARGSFRQQGGQDAAAQLLDGVEPPDALFVANSQMVLGVLAELKRRSLKVGRDIGVVTFDDPPWADFMTPALTSVAQPAYEIGAEAATILLDRVSGAARGAPLHVTLSTDLIIRDSSRRARQAADAAP
jgi:LacI family transcriptional regulator